VGLDDFKTHPTTLFLMAPRLGWLFRTSFDVRRLTFCWSSILLSLCLSAACAAQTASKAKILQTPQDVLEQHYRAARTFELNGDQERAATEYKAFLAEALRRVANVRAGIPDSRIAAELFEDGLQIAPKDLDLHLDFAAMRLNEGKLEEAKSLATKGVDLDPKNPKARYLLGAVLFKNQDYEGAQQQLEAAVVANPNFEIGYLLGLTYLKLNDLKRAARLFDEMVSGLGDTPQIHMYFGRAYREAGLLEQSVQELQKAVAKDSRAQQAHYFLGLAYLGRDGDSGFPAAIPEFRAELALNPNDYRSHYMLGYILLKQRKLDEAEGELKRAAALEPDNPDPLIYLGQLYANYNRAAAAESTLRRAIALTKDVARNDYQINRAHYLLGRLLQHSGRNGEAQHELQLSQELRNQAVQKARNENVPAGPNTRQDEDARVAGTVDAVSAREAIAGEKYVDPLKPAIADAYNNLGVAAAGHKEFATALRYFRKASQWNPSLQTLDRNLGMAAFYAEQYDQATAPLERHLQAHPDDVRVRGALGLSFYTEQNYGKALETLRPLEPQIDEDPGLSYAYAVSMIKTGEYDQGINRLKSLENRQPNSADIHMLLGQALSEQAQYVTAVDEYRKAIALDPKQAQTHYLAGLALIHAGKPAEAINEFRDALKLQPSDVRSKYHLAFALIQTQQKDEALRLLEEVIHEDPKYADAYYQLGKLQIEHGDLKPAILSLEAGARLNPQVDYIHYQLALAYRRVQRIEDAGREMKLYQDLKEQRRSRSGPQPN